MSDARRTIPVRCDGCGLRVEVDLYEVPYADWGYWLTLPPGWLQLYPTGTAWACSSECADAVA